MEKKTKILILLFLLSGCVKDNSASCSRYDQEDSLTLNLYARNDTITMIEVVESFLLPAKAVANEKYFADLKKQFDSSCHLEENRLIRNYGLAIDGSYSLQKTIEELERQRFHCER